MNVFFGIGLAVVLGVMMVALDLWDAYQWRQDQKRWMVILDLELALLLSPHERRHQR